MQARASRSIPTSSFILSTSLYDEIRKAFGTGQTRKEKFEQEHVVFQTVASVLYARLRIDQLASLGWRVLAPLALAQVLVIIWIGVV